MRSAAYSALRNNRSFVPFCRAEKGCIWLQVLPVLDGNSVILCGTTSIQYLSMGRKSRVDCVERWCSTLHNACSAVEECREAARPSVDLSRGREVLATVSTTASRGSPHPALHPTLPHHQVLI